MQRVLIVEDDEAMGVALRHGMTFQGYTVLMATDGATGLQMATERDVDLIILDVMLPNMSGIEVCKRLRSHGSDVPIIMLTARGQELDKVLGLKVGADDYVTKPFSFMELMARVEALLRRTAKRGEGLDVYRFADVQVDFRRLEATKGGAPIELSPREFEIMKYFIEHRGEVVSRDRLLDVVWGYENFPLTRTVDMHIAKLRQKIEDTPGNPRHIITVHRSGYKFIG
jgi:two-component system alkaline phosphatase synthesis response regulator PhoP